MMPTSISQILEQIFNAAVSLIAAWMFIKYFADGTDGSVAKWGAAGSTVGTTAGVVIALLFMLLVYGVNRTGDQTQGQTWIIIMKRSLMARS